MKIKASSLIFCFSSLNIVAPECLAQSIPEAFISERVYNEIELGIGYTQDDAYRFGRFTGLESKGPFLIANVDNEEFYPDGGFWNLHGTNLGLDSRYLRLEFGQQGSYKFFLDYNELPNYKDDSVKTPFVGIGSDNLTLPAGFDITSNLDSNLHNFELQTKRKRITAGVKLIPVNHWNFDIDFSHESKQGIDATAAAIANGRPGLITNVTTSFLPMPVDYETDLVNAILHYGGDNGQFDLKYHMSSFDNGNTSLEWQDPFNPLLASGNISLAPDNEFHQLSVTGGYSLPYNINLTGLISMGRMTQNQLFEPYTINTTLTPSSLPRSSLNGEVMLSTAELKLTSRPTKDLRISADLRYNERDNQTPVDTYNYVILDSVNGAAVQNRPYSFKNNLFNLSANYRFNAITSLRLGYKFNKMKRSYTDAERADTEEDTIHAKWKIKASSNIDLALYAETSSRDGSEYNTPANENPAMRKFHLADRDRDKLSALVDYMATEKLFLSFRADYNQDDYDNSTIGLTEATQPVYTIDFSYQPTLKTSIYGYYTYEYIDSSQAGFSNLAHPSPDWLADSKDKFNIAGIGAKLTELGKWELGTDIVYSSSTGSLTMENLVNPGNENQYPDTKSTISSINFWANYNYNKQLVYKLGYWFEDYSADDWSVDGLQAYDPTTVANSLLLGNQTLDYNAHVITISASYRYH